MMMQSFESSALNEKISSLTLVQKLLLFVGTFTLLVGGFYFFVYKEQMETVQGLEGSISGLENRLASLKKASAQVEILQKQVAESEEELSQLLTLLPDQKEIPGLLESVSELGAKVGLENILFQPQTEQPHEFYATIPVRLDLVGTYHEVGSFFDKVSKLNRILKVQSLGMVRQKPSSLLKVDCTIETYRFLEMPAQTEGVAKQAAKK